MTDKPNPPLQRLDRWLWFARLMKSRTFAAELIGSGKVRVNRVRVVKPSHMLREGDVLTIALRGEVRVIRVLAVGVRRGPPREARLLYRLVDDRDPSTPSQDPHIAPGDIPGRDLSAGSGAGPGKSGRG